MKHNLKVFWTLSLYSIKITFQHRVGFISFLTGKIIRFAFYFAFIYFLVSKTKFLAGYTVNQTLVFFLTFNLIDTLGQLLFREVYRFRPIIVTGEFDGILLRPIHPFFRILIGGVDILDAIMIIPYILLLCLFIALLPQLKLSDITLYIVLLINAMLLMTSFHIAALAIGILTTEIDHVMMIIRDFTRMASIPIDVYQEPVRSFLMFAVPVGVMMALPVKVLFGLFTLQTLMLSGIISLIFIFGSLWLWNYSLKRYQSWGG